MSYVEETVVTQNDYGYDLEFQITDALENPVDLSTVQEIKIFIAEAGKTVAKVVGSCTVINASNGECKYTVQSGDFNEAPKVYEVELELVFPNKVITATGVTIKVRKEKPETTTSTV